ncbi:aminotransferase class IV [Herbiconiux liangxiaofengii]|uniref:aminotransferase class IV n=1 Tax=Herbiconiux liangxiaofengii TaxID=3342795 RepID=UPI0035BAC617
MRGTDPVADAPATFAWHGGALVETELTAHRGLAVADSWYVSPEGRTRAIDAHRDRFLAGVVEQADRLAAETGVDPGERMLAGAERFWGAAIGRLRSYGGSALFPRVELALLDADGAAGSPAGARAPGDPAPAAADLLELRLRVRLAPRLRTSTVLATHDGPDPRTTPRLKGPDLEPLLALRAAALDDGADELVLLRDGLVVDGSTSALLWWRGETLVAPASDLPRVASVTARSIRLIATATGVPVVEERARPADLEGCEVWSVSALHGITVVEGWVGGPTLVARPTRAASWRRRLAALSRPL